MVKIAADLLKAHHVGVRDLKEHVSTEFLKDILVITDRGVPVSVNLPYSDVLELVDILDELRDPETLRAIEDARKAINKGQKAVSVSKLFKRIRSARK